MLDNCDNHTNLLTQMESLRRYFPLTLTTMAAETMESLLLSAKISSYTGTGSSSGSSNPSARMPLSGMMGSSTSKNSAVPPIDIYQSVTDSIISFEEVTLSEHSNKPTEVPVGENLSTSFHNSDVACNVNMGPLSPSLVCTEKSSSCMHTFNKKGDKCAGSLSEIFANCNGSKRTSLLVPFILGTDRLEILAEYNQESATRKKLLRRPGRNVLSLLSDKVYMGDPYHLLVLPSNASKPFSSRRPLFQTGMPPDAHIFPCYWEGTIENRTAARTVVSINGYHVRLITLLSPSVYERFSPSFNPVHSVHFNRTAKLISNAAHYSCIWRLKASELTSRSDKDEEKDCGKVYEIGVMPQVEKQLFLHAPRAASIAFSRRSATLDDSTQQCAHSVSNTNTSYLDTDPLILLHPSNQSPFMEQANGTSTSYIDYSSHVDVSSSAQPGLSSILNFNTLSQDTLSPAVTLTGSQPSSSNTSNYTTPITLNELFRDPLRSKERIRQSASRQLLQHRCWDSRSGKTIPSLSQRPAVSNLEPSTLPPTGNLSVLRRDYNRPDIAHKYAKRREHMFKVAYEMGLSRKV
ncbi:Hypothetical protein GLP15_5051 [Giardia lamblia P15]|uniref:Uncharacterized protein n=1 Tax=Giardia intestinalis (strain P15) TaxID=658858 RepID=E1EZJ3_GIAIA|nr:Hypothetical protein GLP15_5051 [Giardia lamblia P15]